MSVLIFGCRFESYRARASTIAILVACNVVATTAQAMPSIPATQAAALFETTRANLPCVDRIAALLERANITVNPPVLGDEYLSQAFTDTARNLTIEIGAEDTPIGTQLSTTMIVGDTTADYLRELAVSFRSQTGLPKSTAQTLRHTFANGPMVMVFDFNPTTNQTTITATMSPLKVGQDTGC